MITQLNLYLLTRKDKACYDEHIGAVVCATCEEDARSIHPNGMEFSKVDKQYDSWVEKPSDIIVTFIGIPEVNQTRGVILSSFKAG